MLALHQVLEFSAVFSACIKDGPDALVLPPEILEIQSVKSAYAKGLRSNLCLYWQVSCRQNVKEDDIGGNTAQIMVQGYA